MFVSAFVLSELFPGLYGAKLRAELKTYSYQGHKTLGYTAARQHMYGYIYNDPAEQADYCVYTGLKMACKYDSMNADCNADMNCEHTVPQSFFGKSDPMKSDVHHLRATWMPANSARSNYPFKELSDNEVDKWYGNNYQTVTTKPADPENWSALDSGKYFEPRDAQKGDTARAVAYFYTVYPTQAGAVTSVFPNVDTMIEWDQKFPPTATQNAQYLRAVEVQGNKNAFQEELGLVGRAWCDKSTKYPCSLYQ